MVRLMTTTTELKLERAQEKKPVGFVPTMGNLHQGHISLLKTALQNFEVVYFSIFVNPKQFGPKEDFNQYPRTLENDLQLIEACASDYPQRQVIVFSPKDITEIFPEQSEQSIYVSGLSQMLEGAIRPGHFEGVATVVYRLFELVKPKKAYFGLKDYQQYLVIRQMVKDLQLPIEVIGMPIIRDDSGLARSSRNQYLSLEQKQSALILSRTLKQVQEKINGLKANLPAAQSFIQTQIQDANWNYLELRDADSLSTDLSQSKTITLLGVYQLGSTRLLDNLQVELT